MSFINIFPASTDKLHLTDGCRIVSDHQSDCLQTIILTLNRYLEKNEDQISDYHLMLDIVKRNREVRESEIMMMMPFPQYIGLVGTMIGIFIGVLQLVFGGGLDKLLDPAAHALALTDSGIKELLGGVGLAVLTSAVGLILTTRSSYKLKNARKIVEARENAFLSWIQAELLPNIGTDLSSALNQMARNLRDFNSTFSNNTSKLDRTLAKVNESYEGQARILEAIDKIKISKIAAANIEVYDHLKECTEEIGMIGEELKASRQYLAAVKALTLKLDMTDERTKTWERMARFFEQESKELESRKAMISEAVGAVDRRLENAFQHFDSTAEERITNTALVLQDQKGKLAASLDEQQKVFIERLNAMAEEIEKRTKTLAQIFSEQEKMATVAVQDFSKYSRQLDNLSDIKRGIQELKTAILQMNQRTVTSTVDGKSVIVSNSIPKSVRLAIYIIALLCAIILAQEGYLLIKDIIATYL